MLTQIFNLLYRRIVFCGRPLKPRRPGTFGQSADYKSAIQQIENLRYVPNLCPRVPRFAQSWSSALRRNDAIEFLRCRRGGTIGDGCRRGGGRQTRQAGPVGGGQVGSILDGIMDDGNGA